MRFRGIAVCSCFALYVCVQSSTRLGLNEAARLLTDAGEDGRVAGGEGCSQKGVHLFGQSTETEQIDKTTEQQIGKHHGHTTSGEDGSVSSDDDEESVRVKGMRFEREHVGREDLWVGGDDFGMPGLDVADDSSLMSVGAKRELDGVNLGSAGRSFIVSGQGITPAEGDDDERILTESEMNKILNEIDGEGRVDSEVSDETGQPLQSDKSTQELERIVSGLSVSSSMHDSTSDTAANEDVRDNDSDEQGGAEGEDSRYDEDGDSSGGYDSESELDDGSDFDSDDEYDDFTADEDENFEEERDGKSADEADFVEVEGEESVRVQGQTVVSPDEDVLRSNFVMDMENEHVRYGSMPGIEEEFFLTGQSVRMENEDGGDIESDAASGDETDADGEEDMDAVERREEADRREKMEVRELYQDTIRSLST